MMRRIETSDWVPFPVELVFAFFANPQNLPHLMPPRMGVRLEDARLKPAPERPPVADPDRRFRSLAAGVGSELLISFKPLGWGLRLSWTARIVEFVWNSHFVDEQVRGPFAQFRHRHGIEAERREGVEGTRVTDAVEIEMPLALAGQLAAPLVMRQFERSFEFRQQRLPEILASVMRQATRRA